MKSGAISIWIRLICVVYYWKIASLSLQYKEFNLWLESTKMKCNYFLPLPMYHTKLFMQNLKSWRESLLFFKLISSTVSKNSK